MVRGFYAAGPGFLGALQLAVIWFVAFYLGYHIAIFTLTATLHHFAGETAEKVASGEEAAGKVGVADHHHLALFSMYCMGMFAIFTMISNMIRVELILVQVLPAYVIFVIWKGCDFLGIRAHSEGQFIFLASVMEIVSVYVIFFLLYAVV